MSHVEKFGVVGINFEDSDAQKLSRPRPIGPYINFKIQIILIVKF